MFRKIACLMTFGFMALAGQTLDPFGSRCCQAQEWANKMFNTLSHDFGTVARGSKAVYRFQVKNIYEEEAHILSVTSSCGCTTPQIIKPDLKTFEVGEIVAELNTVAHMGQKSATLTVKFDKPFYAEVQLNVRGLIRSDVVVTPGDVELGSVDQGQGIEKKLSIVYAGRNDWQIVDAKTANPHFEVELNEAGRGGGRVAYDLSVRLTKDAPSGYIKDQLILVTNDQKDPELYVDIDGRVISPITVSPASLFMGIVKPGQTVKKKLIVSGKKPFKIVDVNCDDKCFSVEKSDVAKTVHFVPVEFTAEKSAGKISREISLTTDQGQGDSLVFTAYATVVSDNGPADGDGGPKRAEERAGK